MSLVEKAGLKSNSESILKFGSINIWFDRNKIKNHSVEEMRSFSNALALFFLFTLCQSCIFKSEDPKNRRQREHSNWKAPHLSDQDGGETKITVPIETENEKVNLIFELNEEHTVLSITSEVPYEKMFILSSTSGTAFKKNEDHIGIYSTDLGGDLSLNFNLGQKSLIHQSEGQSITEGEYIAETTETVQFYIEDRGRKIPFCIDVVNQARKYVNLSVQGSKKSCR